MSTTALYERLRVCRRRRPRRADPCRGAALEASTFPHAAPRTVSSSMRAARKLSYGELAAQAAKLPLDAVPPLKDRSRFAPDRQAGRAPGHAGQVQWQRDLRHRRRGPRHAQRRHQDGALLHRAGGRDQQRGRNSQDARRARRGEARRRSTIADEDGTSHHADGRAARQRGLRRRRLISGRPSVRSIRSTSSFDRGSARRSLERQDRRHARRRR